MLRSDRGGEFLGKEFTDFVDGKGIVHDLTFPYTPQQNGMAVREMRTAVESVRTMLLHMGVQHHWWHLALRQAVWVCNYLERSTPSPRTTLYQLLTGKKLDLTLARVWGCMGWEVLDLTNNKVVTSVEVIFYETLSLEVWKAKFGPTSGRTQAHPPSDTSTTTAPLLAEVDEPADEDVVEVLPPPLVLAPPFPIADRPASTPVSATSDEGSLEASPVAPASGIAGGRQGAKLVDQDGKPSTIGEQQTGELVEQEAAAEVQSRGERPKSVGGEQLVESSKQLVDDLTVDKEGELSPGEESTDSDVVEVPIMKPELRRTGRARRPPVCLSFHACLPPAAFTVVYDEVVDDLLYHDAEEDEELPELDPDMHADPEHRWDIATMSIKEALASWKGEAVKTAMEEEIRSLVSMGTWELVKRPRGVNIMKNRWVLTTKYRLDDTVEHEKARLVVKGFTQVCGADYDETYLPVRSYVTLRIFLIIVAAFDLNLMQLDMKNVFLQSKLNIVLYMYQPDYFDDGTGRRGALLQGRRQRSDLLGLEIVRDRPAGKLWLHRQGYADKLRRCFIDEVQGGRAPKTPVSVDAYAKLTFDDEEAQEHEEEEYQQKVGSLQFAARRRGRTSRSPAASWGAASRSRIKCATLSSTESEYVAATNAGKEGRRLRFLLAEFKLLDAGKPTILRVDNKSAITVTESLGLTGNLKHMERRYAWLQHMVRRRKFVLKYIPTTEQPTDFLTKALHFPAFNRCSVAIGKFVWPTSATATMMCSSRCRALLHRWCGDGVFCEGCTPRSIFLRSVLLYGLEPQA
ncbi:unnamed protein product [Closterium sp. NIES-54]